MYKLYEDNAGGFHLAVLDCDGNCVFYLCDNDEDFVRNTLNDIKAGGDPVAEGWEGGEPNPQECYDVLRKWEVATHDRAVLVEEG